MRRRNVHEVFVATTAALLLGGCVPSDGSPGTTTTTTPTADGLDGQPCTIAGPGSITVGGPPTGAVLHVGHPGSGITSLMCETTTTTTTTSVTTTTEATTTTTIPPTGTHLVINEIDYDQPVSDSAEFVEVYNPRADPVSLSGLALSFINGATGTEYLRVALNGAGTLAAGAYLVVGSPGLSVPAGTSFIAFGLASNNIQNGNPDGVALVDTATPNLVDALSYGGSVTTTIPELGSVSLVEGAPTPATDSGTVTGSLSRLPNGADNDNATVDWAFTSTVTPGSPNT